MLSRILTPSPGTKRLAVALQLGSLVAFTLSSNSLHAQSGPCLAPPAGLVGWWRGDGNPYDSTGTNQGVWSGNAAYAAGEVGQAFSFDGAGSVVQVPDAPALDFTSTSPMTVELWAYRTGNQSTMYLLGKQAASCGSFQYQLGFTPIGGLTFAGGAGQVQTGVTLPLNTWVHLAATFDGATFRFYYNALLIGTGTGNLGAANNAPLTIGGASSCASFGGLLDEVGVYQRALTGAEIQRLYAAGSAGKCLPPPRFVSQPQPVALTNSVGAAAAFGAVAVGAQPLNYQWLFNGTNLAGATQAGLSFTNLSTSQAGTYALAVSNSVGGIVSSNVSLVVTSAPPPMCTLAQLTAAVAAGGTYSFACDGTILLTQTLTNNVNLVLDGAGHNVVISGNNLVRIFLVNPGVSLTLRNLTLANGSNVGVTDTHGLPGQAGWGGGIADLGGNVTLINCNLIGNTATGGNGYGAGGTDTAVGGDALGAAIFIAPGGALYATNTLFATNTATAGYAGKGVGGNGLGGAVYNTGGTLRLEACQFAANQAVGGAGDNGSQPVGPDRDRSGGGYGGGLSTTNGDVTLSHCTFVANVTGSALNNNTISSIYQNSNAGGGGVHQASGALRVIGCVFATNTAVGPGVVYATPFAGGNGLGGGILNFDQLALTKSTFLGNQAQGGSGGTPRATGLGGGLANFGTTFCVNNSFVGNLALGAAGGKYASGAGFGGGIYNSNTLWLLANTLAGNTAAGGEGNEPDPRINQQSGGYSDGGPAYGGGLCNQGALTATNNTFAANLALGGQGGTPYVPPQFMQRGISAAGGNSYGGAVYNNGGAAWFAFNTFYSNSAAGGAGVGNSFGATFGGGLSSIAGTLTLADSIVAYSTAGNCFGFITDAGHNLGSDATSQFTAPGSLNNTDPLLGPPANNGGPTLTCALLAGSPALGAASATGAPATDQRGVARPSGAGFDSGAYQATNAQAFLLRGSIAGFLPPGGITLATSAGSTLVDAQGNFTLTGLPAGAYTLTPSASGVLFVPAALPVTVGPNQSGLLFQSYQLNAFNGPTVSNGVLRATFAGTNGQHAALDTSADLRTWTPLTTNLIGAGGLLNLSPTNHPGQKAVFYRLRSF